MAFDDPDITAVYMLTDGKPDTSTSMVLKEVSEMNVDRKIPINTISFNCSDRFVLVISQVQHLLFYKKSQLSNIINVENCHILTGVIFEWLFLILLYSTANNFLHLMAQETSGRYHRCQTDFDAQLFAHKLLTEGFEDTEYPHLPEFEGDDLRRLGSEINTARKYLAQSRQYR